jgi:hypothetical protein
VPEVAVAVGHGEERGMVVGWSGVRREKVERRDETSEGEGESRVGPEVFSSFSREKRQLACTRIAKHRKPHDKGSCTCQ